MTDEAKALAIINRLEREKGIYLSDMDMVLRRYPLTFGVIGRQATQIERLREALGAALNIIDRAYRKYGTEFDAEDTAKAIAARAALAGDSHDQ